mmetsp:Transcript_620/g.1930  ORF Transcript_620/g.1930 Transcript_620/m.1930 type:complete len:453 (+) Transcript_620:392-1750(+)
MCRYVQGRMCKRSGPRRLLELAVRGLRVLDPADLVAVEELRRQRLEPLEALAVDLEVAPRPLVVEPEAAAGDQSALARVVLEVPQQGLADVDGVVVGADREHAAAGRQHEDALGPQPVAHGLAEPRADRRRLGLALERLPGDLDGRLLLPRRRRRDGHRRGPRARVQGVGRGPELRDEVHVARPDLHLEGIRRAVQPHQHRRVQRLVAVGLGAGHVVLGPVLQRLPGRLDQVQRVVAQSFAGGHPRRLRGGGRVRRQGRRVQHNPERDGVQRIEHLVARRVHDGRKPVDLDVRLGARAQLPLFAPHGVGLLLPRGHPQTLHGVHQHVVLDHEAPQPRGHVAADDGPVVALPIEGLEDLGPRRRGEAFKGRVLEVVLELVEPEAVRERGEDVQRVARARRRRHIGDRGLDVLRRGLQQGRLPRRRRRAALLVQLLEVAHQQQGQRAEVARDCH